MIIDVDSYVSHGGRPDLLILFGKPDLETYVLEAKGNSRGRTYSLGQLKRGIKQVLAAPGKAQRLVVSTAAPGPALNVHAISVEPGEARPDEDVDIVPPRRALGMELDRLASFAAAPSPEEEGTPLPVPALGVDLVGRQVTLAGENLTARVTMGVDREIFRRLSEVGSLGELAEMRAGLRDDNRPLVDEQLEAVPLTEVGQAAAIAQDGCALAIELR